MQAGRLDRRITIEVADAAVDDGLRSKPGGWLKLCDRWAALMPLSGAEQIAAGENAAFQTQKFRVRRTRELAGMTPATHRVIYADRVYDLTEVREIDRDAYDLIGTARPDLAAADVDA